PCHRRRAKLRLRLREIRRRYADRQHATAGRAPLGRKAAKKPRIRREIAVHFPVADDQPVTHRTRQATSFEPPNIATRAKTRASSTKQTILSCFRTTGQTRARAANASERRWPGFRRFAF